MSSSSSSSCTEDYCIFIFFDDFNSWMYFILFIAVKYNSIDYGYRLETKIKRKKQYYYLDYILSFDFLRL